MVGRPDSSRTKSVDFTVASCKNSAPLSKCPIARVLSTRHTHLRELRIQHRGRPYWVLYAFDARRAALLLLGGDKTGKNRWYEEFVPMADTIYDRHLIELDKEY